MNPAQHVQPHTQLINLGCKRIIPWTEKRKSVRHLFRNTPWKKLNVDAVYVINLKERKDRLISIKKVLTKACIPLKAVTLVSVVRHADGFFVGCASSHKQIAVDCIYNDFNRVLVFEDDLQNFDPGWKQQIQSVANVMNTDTNIERALLGYYSIALRPYSFFRHGLTLMKGKALCTHAVVANLDHMKRIETMDFSKTSMKMRRSKGIDYDLNEIASNTLMPFPPVVRQSQDFVSDGVNRKRVYFGSRRQAWLPVLLVCTAISLILFFILLGIFIVTMKYSRS
jgi:GR25 family glycosyltransferase involved in LPS biosynthesis